jgi:hypothetical protein
MIQLETTLGLDPELILVDSFTNKPVSAMLVLGQDKHDPIDLGDGVKCYADNVLIEASMPPSLTIDGAVTQVGNAFEKIQKMLGTGYRLLPQASAIYEDKHLVKVPPKTPRYDTEGRPVMMDPWETGCNPNHNAYTFGQNKPAKFMDGMRTGSFHIHIGDRDCMTRGDSPIAGLRAKAMAVMLMDVFVGCGITLIEDDPTSSARRRYYGRAGEYRPTDYGFEYRVLGNWALRSPQTVRLAYQLADHAMSYIRNGTAKELLEKCGPFLVQKAINVNSKALARAVLDRAGLPDDLMVKLNTSYQPDLYEDWGMYDWLL